MSTNVALNFRANRALKHKDWDSLVRIGDTLWSKGEKVEAVKSWENAGKGLLEQPESKDILTLRSWEYSLPDIAERLEQAGGEHLQKSKEFWIKAVDDLSSKEYSDAVFNGFYRAAVHLCNLGESRDTISRILYLTLGDEAIGRMAKVQHRDQVKKLVEGIECLGYSKIETGRYDEAVPIFSTVTSLYQSIMNYGMRYPAINTDYAWAPQEMDLVGPVQRIWDAVAKKGLAEIKFGNPLVGVNLVLSASKEYGLVSSLASKCKDSEIFGLRFWPVLDDLIDFRERIPPLTREVELLDPQVNGMLSQTDYTEFAAKVAQIRSLAGLGDSVAVVDNTVIPSGGSEKGLIEYYEGIIRKTVPGTYASRILAHTRSLREEKRLRMTEFFSKPLSDEIRAKICETVPVGCSVYEVASINALVGLVKATGFKKMRVGVDEKNIDMNLEQVRARLRGLGIDEGNIRSDSDTRSNCFFIMFVDKDQVGDRSLLDCEFWYNPFKFILPTRIPDTESERIRTELRIPVGSRVIVIGSPKPNESNMVERRYASLPVEQRPYIIFAPRGGVEGGGSGISSGIEFASKKKGITENGIKAILLDTMGELLSVYSIADAAIVGSDRNILEPVSQGADTYFFPGDWHNNYYAKDLLKKYEAARAVAYASDIRDVLLGTVPPVKNREVKVSTAINKLKQNLAKNGEAVLKLALIWYMKETKDPLIPDNWI